MKFEPGFIPPGDASGTAFWFLFQDQRLLVRSEEDDVKLPLTDHPPLPLAGRCLYLGVLDGYPCFTAEAASAAGPPDGFSFEGLRGLYGRMEATPFQVAGLGLQIVAWDRDHRFCSRCGAPLQDREGERAKECTGCDRTVHPRISPAIIVAVVRDGRLLLGLSRRYRDLKRYSVLAGYVEVGEHLEATVQRELMEEVGIRVRNIRYFGSQSWPYSGSLMVAFTAEYAAGDIRVDGSEIVEAGWFPPHLLPRVPGQDSIAGQLIDWFVKTCA